MGIYEAESRKIIMKIFAELGGAPLAEIKEAIDAAYPFGPHVHHPYRIWCRTKRQLLERAGLIPVKPRKKKPKINRVTGDPIQIDHPEQTRLEGC